MSTPAATIVLSTKNRRDELRPAIASCLTQSIPVEVIVLDDGSTDGTTDMVRAEFPSVQLHSYETSAGYMVRRNRGARLASAPIVFSIDDDAVLISPNTVEQTIRDFSDPRIGAVAIPYIDVRISPEVRQRAPDTSTPYVLSEFRGTACAFRRDLFLQLGGWREVLFHQTEEGDYCLRMLSEGFLVRAGTADPLHHLESPKRDLTRMITFNARNNILFAWHNVPLRMLLPHVAATKINLLRFGLKKGYPLATIRGLWRATLDILRGRVSREPITFPVYRVHRWLRAAGTVPLAEALQRLDAARGQSTPRT